MISNEMARAVVFSAPLVSALFCLGLTALDAGRAPHPVRRNIQRRMIATYCLLALVWFMLVLHEVAHNAFLYCIPLLGPIVMACEILTYRVIRTNTDSGGRRRFPFAVHLIPAALMLVAMLVVVLAVPPQRLEGIVYGPHGGFAKYVVAAICVAYSIVYPVMGLVEIWRYRRKITDSAHGKTLDWIFGAMLVEVVVLPVPMFGLLVGMAPFTGGGFVWTIAVAPALVMYIVSCCNMLSDNYMIIEPDAPKSTEPETNAPPRLNKERMEQYLDAKKPYLNPAYRITDMAEDLFTNRAYISAFINKEYKMNFSHFVNGYRLREVEKLREEAARKKQHVPALQLILNAGFGNYRSYLRAKNETPDTDGSAE